jgi:uncharacterized protein
MRVTITGASGLIGTKLRAALQARGDEVIPVSLRDRGPIEVGDVVVHLAGENVAQRWTDESRKRIEESRVEGTRRVVEAINHAETRPTALISSSAVGYYGKHGDEKLDESTPPGDDFLARVCVAWEREAQAAEALGLRVVRMRTGIVLDRAGGALAKMLPFFRLGVGGPVAGGRQYMPWIHAEDIVSLYLAAVDGGAGGTAWRGPINGAAPEPVTNREFSRELGRALHRPAFAPVPGFAVRLLYGEMAAIVTAGQRAVPSRSQALGFRFGHPALPEALRSALD